MECCAVAVVRGCFDCKRETWKIVNEKVDRS